MKQEHHEFILGKLIHAQNWRNHCQDRKEVLEYWLKLYNRSKKQLEKDKQ